MDIYLTDKATGDQIGLSMLPTKLKQKGSARYQSYDFLQVGEVRLPNGTRLNTYSWSGTLPGEAMKGLSFVKEQLWQHPKELVATLERWRTEGAVLVLMVTETWINGEVTISDFSPTPSGGLGNVDYSITLQQYREAQVFTVAELQDQPVALANQPAARAAAPAPNTYTVVKGDSLWAIAKRFLGAGSRYGEIYALNKDVIGKDPGLIYPGQVLTLPG